MVVNINDFNSKVALINKNHPIFSGKTKAVNAEVFRFKNFSAQAGMKRVIFKKGFLFLKSF